MASEKNYNMGSLINPKSTRPLCPSLLERICSVADFSTHPLPSPGARHSWAGAVVQTHRSGHLPPWAKLEDEMTSSDNQHLCF